MASMDTHGGGRLEPFLAASGTALCLLPFAATLLLSLVASALERRVLVDVLMPFELFPAYLVGAIALQVLGFRTQRQRLTLTLSTVVAIAALLGSQALAQATGLASAERAPAGWPLAAVVSLLVAAAAAMLVTAASGVRLTRALWAAWRQDPSAGTDARDAPP